MVSRASVAKFQQIYFQEYGINLDEQTAYELQNTQFAEYLQSDMGREILNHSRS